MVVDGLGFQSGNFSSGLANNIVFESSGLNVPFLHGATFHVGSAVLSHVVVFLQFELGLEGLFSFHSAFSNVHLVLGNVNTAGNDLAVSVSDDGSNGSVNLSVTGFGGGGGDHNAHAQLVLIFGHSGSLFAAASDQRQDQADQKSDRNKLFHSLDFLSQLKILFRYRYI